MTLELSRDVPNARVWIWVHRAAAFATVLPLFFSRHPPFSDMPEHLALIATMRHWWDPAWKSQTYFVFEGLGHTQYWLYHVVGALLAIPLRSAERAVFVLTIATGLGFPYSLRALARSLDRDPRIGLVGAPLFWSLALGEGLMNYVASIPVAFWAISVAIQQMREPSRKRAIVAAVLPVTLMYLHLSAFLFFGIAVLGAALVLARDVFWRPPRHISPLLYCCASEIVGRAPSKYLSIPRSPSLAFGRSRIKQWADVPREILRRLPWLPVSLGLCILFVGQSIVTHPGKMSGEHAGVIHFLPARILVRQLFGWMHDFWFSPWDERLGYVLWIFVGVLLIFSIRRNSLSKLGIVAAIVVAAALGLYFLMPNQIGYAFLLDLRMAPVVGMSVSLLISARSETLKRVCFGGVAGVGLLVGVHGAYQMARFEREEAAHFELLLRNLPAGKRLLMLIFQRESRIAQIAPFVHFGSYYRARYGGVASFSFTELPHWPLQYRPEVAPPKKAVTFWDWNPCLFRNSTDGPYYDFILTRGEVQPFANQPPGPRWMVIGGARDWKLYAHSPNGEPWSKGGPDVGPCAESERDQPDYALPSSSQ